jgi:hypothetical protein
MLSFIDSNDVGGRVNEEQYRELFKIDAPKTNHASSFKEKALDVALDIRKFEIDLYWRRATYFWAFIAVALGGHVTVLGMKDISTSDRGDALITTSCLGLVFSTAWYFINRASKYWQENWEAHVDLLENETIGPLYKTVISDHRKCFWSLWAPYPFSVSKINQTLSLFVFSLFLLLTVTTLFRFFKFGYPPDLYATGIVGLTSSAMGLLYWKGRTSTSVRQTKAVSRRMTNIE